MIKGQYNLKTTGIANKLRYIDNVDWFRWNNQFLYLNHSTNRILVIANSKACSVYFSLAAGFRIHLILGVCVFPLGGKMELAIGKERLFCDMDLEDATQIFKQSKLMAMYSVIKDLAEQTNS